MAMTRDEMIALLALQGFDPVMTLEGRAIVSGDKLAYPNGRFYVGADTTHLRSMKDVTWTFTDIELEKLCRMAEVINGPH
jgi:hypothetical protein